MGDGPVIVNAYDIVEANGKTWRENNRAKPHRVPLGTKLVIPQPLPAPDDYVEVFIPGIKGEVTCYVVKHGRDCDGSPLYVLSPYAETSEGEPLWEWLATISRDLDRSMAKPADLSEQVGQTYKLMALTRKYRLSGGFGEEFVLRYLAEGGSDDPLLP